MTEDEMRQADEAFDADPGVKPDFQSFRSHAELAEDPNRLAEMFQAQHDQGAVAYRKTNTDDGVWVEGWLVTPHKQAAFDPPLTYKGADS